MAVDSERATSAERAGARLAAPLLVLVVEDEPVIARMVDLTRAHEDEHLSARLDDVERSTSVAQLDDLIAWLGRAMVGPVRPRPLEYRKLVAVQVAARARREELVGRSAAPGSDREVS